MNSLQSTNLNFDISTLDKRTALQIELFSSFLLFTRLFYKLRTNREFNIPHPIGRESHIITICRALTKVFYGETTRLMINIPPRYGKTELIKHFVAWGMARYPDSNFLYVSYSHDLAEDQTKDIKHIIQMPFYRDLFNVKLKRDMSAKDKFETENNGAVFASGEGGAVTGRGAGLKEVDRFGGAIVLDDIHKPEDVYSETKRKRTNNWFTNTLLSRVNSKKTPIIYIGHRLHEDDLCHHLEKTHDFTVLKLKALDDAGNALNPEFESKQHLLNFKKVDLYTFSSQYQQEPSPVGGSIFKKSDFYIVKEEPEIICTFVTADTAETDKDWNDASVFSFWGIYKIKDYNSETGLYGLHWIDCHEFRVEPSDLEPEFDFFMSKCLSHKVKPDFVAIEEKSTGATLVSMLKARQGMKIIGIKRTKGKISRYNEMQPYISRGQVSLPYYGRHTSFVLDHMSKITRNNSHAHDDICDTAYDAVLFGLIEQMPQKMFVKQARRNPALDKISLHTRKITQLTRKLNG